MTAKEYQALVKGKKKPSKFRNVKVEVDGRVFDSKKEAARYVELKQLLQAHQIQAFECQKKYPYQVVYQANGMIYSKKAFYRADFTVHHTNGQIDVEDVKGRETDVFKLKKRIIKELYGPRIIS